MSYGAGSRKRTDPPMDLADLNGCAPLARTDLDGDTGADVAYTGSSPHSSSGRAVPDMAGHDLL